MSNILIEDNQTPISSTVKLLYLSYQNLTFKQEAKNLFSRMACEVETLNAIKNPFIVHTRLIVINALVLRHLLYSSVELLN